MSQSSKQSSTSQHAITFAEFNAINVDDFSKLAPAGSQLKALTAQFGKPANTENLEQNGKKAKVATWQKVAQQPKATISVSFVNDKAFGKSLNNYQPDNPKTITLADFDKLTTDESADVVLGQFGLPNQVNNIYISGSSQVTYTYEKQGTNKNGKIFLTFLNNKLQGHTQTNLD